MNISQETLDFPSGGLYQKIATMAKTHYKPVGQNSWKHIQQVYSQAARCLRFCEHREMTPVEFAAIVYHDSSVMVRNSKEKHNEYGAMIAKKDLATLFNEDDLDTIAIAIIEHDDNPQMIFTSSVGDLLASGDFNPPDVEWILNKSYTWGIKKGLAHEQRIQNTLRTMPAEYGTNGSKTNYPKYYRTYFKDRLKAFQKAMDSLTYKKVEAIVLAYRQKHGLSDTDLTLPDSSVETFDEFLARNPEYAMESFDLYQDNDRKIALDVIKTYIDDAADPDAEAERILEYYVARTEYHIKKVVQFSHALADRIDDGHLAKILLETCENHDRDKLDDPQYVGMYAPMQMKRYAPALAEGYALAPGYDVFWDHSVVTKHCLRNDHHPEKYADGYKDDSENNPPYDVTSMPDESLVQTMADWMAVSFEKGMKAMGYYQGPASKRYIFSDHQKAFIEKCLQYEDECQAEVAKTERHFKTLGEAEAYVNEHYHGHRKFYDETTKRLLMTCRCPHRIHSGIPDCFIEEGLTQMHEREKLDEEYWKQHAAEAEADGEPIPESSTEGLIDTIKKTFKGMHIYKNLFDFMDMQAQTHSYSNNPASWTYWKTRVSAKYIYERIRMDVLNYWDKETDHAIKFAAENRYPQELTEKPEDYSFHPPVVKRSNIALSEFAYKSRCRYVRKRLDEITEWKTYCHRQIDSKSVGSEYEQELKKLDQIPDKRYVPYIKRVLERWLLEARARAKGMTDKVDFYYKEYKTELSNLSGTPSSESLDTSSEMIQNPEQHPLDFPSLMEFGMDVIVKEPETQVKPSQEWMMGMMKDISEPDPLHYKIHNFPTNAFKKRLFKMYRTHNIEKFIQAVGLKFIKNGTILVHKFFIPELLFLLEKMNYSLGLRNSIVSGTWVSNPPSTKTVVDFDRIKREMTDVEFLPHQIDFLQTYAANKDKNYLRGYLLSFEQGLGKTMTSLALMTGLNKDVVIILCPKNTMLETWDYHLQRFFSVKQDVYITGVTKEYTGQKWCIFNYDALPKLEAMLPLFAKKKVGLIVDESHNFLRAVSGRTKALMALVQTKTIAPYLDVLLMSGTPVKCFGVEMIPLLHVLDPFFDEEADETFRKAFGLNTYLASDILHNRLIRMMTRVTKEVLHLPPKTESVIKVKMKTGQQYTVSAVKKAILDFAAERQEYHTKMMPTYLEEWQECTSFLELTFGTDPNYLFWKQRVTELIDDGGHFIMGDKSIAKMNEIEKTILEPKMPSNILKKFRHCKAAVKYLQMKIHGEVLGQCLGRLRIKMTTELMQASPLVDLIEEAEKKTIIFTSFVDTVELTEDYLRENDFNPIAVYGKTSGDLAALVKAFQTDPAYNPLVASIQTLATGATLTAANRVIFLNKPWRSTDYQQASDRVHRIGQDAPVDIISIVLDTGEEGNLSTRMEDIMNLSNELFGQIVDGNATPEDQSEAALRAAYESLWDQYSKDYKFDQETEVSEEGLNTTWTPSMLQTPADLARFYESSSYGTVVGHTKYTGRQLTKNVIDRIRILSPEKQIRNMVGTCYDTVGLSAYYLTRWKIPYRMYFVNTRKEYDKEKGIWDDPTHLFLIYQNEDKQWVWLEGSWGSYKGSHKPWDNPGELVHDIVDKLRADNGNHLFCRLVHKYPGFNLTIHDFYQLLIQDSVLEFSTEGMEPIEVKPKQEASMEAMSVFSDISMEAEAASAKKALRKKIEDYIIKSINLMERTTKVNEKYWKDRFASMSDADFDKFMHCLKDGTENVHMYVPPLKVHLRNADLVDAAHKLGVKLMHRIWMQDETTGLRYLTPEEYLVVQLPVRRQQQFLDEKISVPENDKQIDGMTGQVTGDSKACAVTNPEIHIMQARNLDASLYEYVNVRGGNIANYAEFKRSLEETGTVSLKSLDGSSRTRVSVVAGILLKGMHLDSNFNENL